jgi:hypothetical protein
VFKAPRIDRVIPLSEGRAAYDQVARGEARGRVVLAASSVISRAARTIANTIGALAILGSLSTVAAQVLRNPPTPYHFLRYEDLSSDQNDPNWPNDFWSPLKFIPLDLVPGSYINFGGEDRERVEHFNNPSFSLTPQGALTYDLHRLYRADTTDTSQRFPAAVSPAQR